MLSHEAPTARADRGHVELGEHLPVAVDALGHADDPLPVDERHRGTSQPSLGTRMARAIGTRSSNPLVVTRPARRPVREAMVLVTAVVPRPNRETVGRSAWRVVPARSATSRHASSTPRPSSPGVLGALARQVLVPSESTASVKVPPRSTRCR
jgi:hypothetical protein